jgi:uncharacterized iron-regulated membrane protein
MNSSAILKWHRRLGLIAAVGVILSSLSGILHPIMTRLQPEPAKLAVDHRVPPLHDAIAPRLLLSANGLATISDLRILSWAGNSYYQVTLPDGASRYYFDLVSGTPLPNGDRNYAEYLAREFVGERATAVRAAKIINSFDWEYPRLNRLLPVWRIEFARPDLLRAYVDTRTGRLGTLVDRTKGFSSIEFAIAHRWQWLDPIAPALRLIVLSLVLLVALGVTLSGCWIYIARWSHSAARWNLRRIHRVWGVSISLVSFMFALSGGYHLLHLGLRGDPGERSQPPLRRHHAANLQMAPHDAVKRAGLAAVESISLAQIDGQTYYRVQPASGANAIPDAAAHQHGGHVPQGKVTPGQVAGPGAVVFVSALDGTVLPDGELRFAAEIAHSVGPRSAGSKVTIVTQFDDEYGFAFKRLPVYRVPLAGNQTAYVDTADGSIAAVIDNADRAEGWVFAYVHKLEWLTPVVGTDWRDLIAAMLAFSLAVAALFGIAVYAQLFRSAKSPVGKLCGKK